LERIDKGKLSGLNVDTAKGAGYAAPYPYDDILKL